jgi:hypothetical protein
MNCGQDIAGSAANPTGKSGDPMIPIQSAENVFIFQTEFSSGAAGFYDRCSPELYLSSAFFIPYTHLYNFITILPLNCIIQP